MMVTRRTRRKNQFVVKEIIFREIQKLGLGNLFLVDSIISVGMNILIVVVIVSCLMNRVRRIVIYYCSFRRCWRLNIR